ncbi:ABC transporter substrate-binding protein [Piscinibacter sp.]|uniref:ABC transporter substrate-binding protein n=1 Tax=Piscinibacter sp. TaxID=1903157 RepID=UPI002C644A82|nr:ABC transporter substrate-binding protein [Albitalea sp.]HUG22010.1 ABC transporter substrate-binding protein [Albitalea sp.]
MWMLLRIVTGMLFMFVGAAAAAAPFKVMIISWTGCEEACAAFQAHLKEHRPEVIFLLRDAARQKDTLPGFVAEARAARVALILTYGTNVTLGVAGRLDERTQPQFAFEIPKLFMVVADPVGAGLVRNLDEPGRDDLSGTVNRVPEQVNIETLRSYRPGFRRLGLLFHADEQNSVMKRNELAALAPRLGFELVAREMPLQGDGRPRASDIAPQVLALQREGVDFLYLGSSSFLRDNADLLTGAAVAVGLPVLSPYESAVRDAQALLSVAARYADIGRLAAAQADRMLDRSRSDGALPVARMTRFAVVINMQVARRLKLFPPLELMQIAETVH